MSVHSTNVIPFLEYPCFGHSSRLRTMKLHMLPFIILSTPNSTFLAKGGIWDISARGIDQYVQSPPVADQLALRLDEPLTIQDIRR